MIVCPNCQHEEYSGALFCGRCGAQLLGAEGSKTTTAMYNTAAIQETVPEAKPLPFPEPTAEAKNALVALWVVDSDQTIFLGANQEFSLGRATAGQPVVPDIDLTPFNAYETGVSRLHASISVRSKPITVQDLGSVNGTRLNGQKLSPHAKTPLAHGDILTLGKLKVQVLVRS